MKISFSNKTFKHIALVLGSSAFLWACKYDIEDMGPKATASFTVTPISGQVNRYEIRSNSQNTFIHEWDKGTGAFVRGKGVDTLYFPDKGTYTVRLLAYGPGGIDSTKNVINVAADDPASLTPMKMLTGNSTKKWKLAPEAGALWIGPSDYSQTWWANSMADVAERACQFNDVITFNVNGTMVMDMKGDFYVDAEGGNAHPSGMPAVGCHPVSAIPSQFQAWTGGNHTFNIINNTQLKVNGTGAFMGLYKAGTTEAAVTGPQSSVTYKIVSITQNRLVLKLDYGWGAWQFIYVPA